MTSPDRAASSQQYRYRFGSAEFDEARMQLKVDGAVVEVQRRPLEVLVLLLRHAGEVVTREELLETVWEGRPTVEHVINNALLKLRTALGPANAERVVTQPRTGYRFEGPMERVAVGRTPGSALALFTGNAVPGRGNFLLHRQLGRSGEHEVWLARHSRTGEQRVYKFCTSGTALSGLKREATLSRVLHRLLGERADLVRMIDWNFETEPFFLESEYGGLQLREWAAQDGHLTALSLEQRLELFLQAADAVAAAHSVGVLHKDLKPANILVAREQDRWQVRIADFGSARLLHPERLDALAMTRLGFTVSQRGGSDSDSGTPLYLAPELLSGAVSTERSDVYALGLILYQIVVADLSRPLVPGWERDVEDPLLRADIARATDVDPQQRLSGAAVLSELLRTRPARQLQQRESGLREQELQRLVLARRRQAARAPWIYASIAVLLVGVAVGSFLYWRVRRAGLELAQQNEVVLRLNDFLSKDLIAAANPDQAGRVGVTVAEAATRAAGRIDQQFANGPLAVRAALHEAMQQAFVGLADLPNAVEEGQKALRDYQRLPAADPAHVASLRLQLASNLAMLSRFEEAGRLVDTADVATLTGTAGINAQVRRLYVQAVIAVNQLALPAALANYQAADALARAHPEVDADLRERIVLELGDTFSLQGDHTRGEAVLRQLIEDQLAAHGSGSLQAEYTRVGLAGSLGYQGRYDEAIALLQHAQQRFNSAYGPDHRRTLKALLQLANVYFQRGDYTRAAAQYATLHERLVRRSGAAQDMAVSMASNEALALMYAGATARAATIFRDTLAVARTFLPAAAPRVQTLQYNLAYCELDLGGDTAGIARLLQDLDPVALGAAQQAPDWDGRLAYQRGRLALMQGHYDAARTLLGKALEIIAERNPDGSIAPTKIRKLIEQTERRHGS